MRVKRNNFMIMLSIMVGYTITYVDKQIIGFAKLPIQEQFGFTDGQSGLIISFFYLGVAIATIPAGFLIDKLGYKKMLLVSLLTTAVFTLLFGIIGGFYFFLVTRMLIGAGQSPYAACVTKATGDLFEQDKKVFMQSILLSASGIGGIVSALVAVRLLDIHYSYVYFFMAIMYVISAILIYFFVPEIVHKEKTADGKVKSEKIPIAKTFLQRNAVVLQIVMFIVNFVNYGVMGWMPSYLKTVLDLPTEYAAYITGGNAVMFVVGTIVTGKVISSIFKGHEKIVVCICSFIMAASLLYFTSAPNLAIAIACYYISGLMAVTIFTVSQTLPHRTFKRKGFGTAVSSLTMAAMIGAFIAPTILGYLIELSNGEYFTSFLCLAIVSIVGAFAIFGIKFPKDLKELEED